VRPAEQGIASKVGMSGAAMLVDASKQPFADCGAAGLVDQN
jgi:hypothetical protein